jgi:Site-specific recombinases, DNA invertase Pin homologs
MKTYIAYLRQSTAKQQISGLGIEAQREIIRRHVKDEAIILHEFIETETGKKNDRPMLMEALKLCRQHKSTLICAKLDRLSRNVAFTSRLLESDVDIVFCDFPQANRLILHIISSIAEYEANLISIRTRQALEAKKQRGTVLGKPENLLDNLGRAILRSNATNMQKALDNENNQRAAAIITMMRGQGYDYACIARSLNEQGFKTSRNCAFSATQVIRLCKRYDIG